MQAYPVTQVRGAPHGEVVMPNSLLERDARRSWRHRTTLVARVLLALAVLGADFLGGSFREVGAQLPEEQNQESTSPADAYGIRYAARGLVMPKGMIRGTFDVVIGRDSGFETTTLNFGAAISPVNHLELGFSRYRMGSYPNPDLFRATGGDGLIPIIAQGQDLVPVLGPAGGAFGDMFAYARVAGPDSGIVNFGLDLGFLIPTASEFGMLIGIPIRFHGGEVFAFDTGLMINLDYLASDFESMTSISFPWNVVLSVTDEVFVKINSGLNAVDVATEGSLIFFPLGFGLGATVSSERIMSDVFAGFSWPYLGTVGTIFDTRFTEATTDAWTITIGVNFYSRVLF